MGNLLQPAGGNLASTPGGEVELFSNIRTVYEAFEATPQEPEYKDHAVWWYKTICRPLDKETSNPRLRRRGVVALE